MFCAGAPLLPSEVAGASLGFLAFCLGASSIYIFNDLVDLERDKLHSGKRLRPLAAGLVSHAEALILAGTALVLCLILAFWIASAMLAILATYLVLNLFYSLFFKQVAILDVMMISAGFILRLAAGAQSGRVKVSAWLILCAFFLSLFLAFGKRRAELNGPDPTATRKVLGQYTELMLDRFSNISATLSIATYAVFTVISRPDHALLLTCPPVLYGMFRYLLLIETRQEGRGPELVLTKDRPIQLAILVWLLLYSSVLYLGLRISVI